MNLILLSILKRGAFREWISSIIPKFSFMAGQPRDWTTGAIAYV
jgi:hypothetical protein